MWGWLTSATGAVWNFGRGAVSSLLQGSKWLANTLFGIGEYILTIFGIMPWKKLRVQAVVLLDEKRLPVADRDEVQKAVDLAAEVFAREMHVRLSSPYGHVVLNPEAAPSNVLEVGCNADIWGAQFTGVGAWFRQHQVRRPAGTVLGYGEPVTVFVVRDVSDKRGCCPPGFLADYCVIDPVALQGLEGSLLTLAHEVAHACNLTHLLANGTLMQRGHEGRPRRLARWQKAFFRSSPHVTYV
jgi:hypothetical protein